VIGLAGSVALLILMDSVDVVACGGYREGTT
jgi:hypothetical protein